MPMRELTPTEKQDVLNRLENTKKQLQLTNSYIAELNRQLQEGTWTQDREVAKQQWEWAEQITKKDRELFDTYEIEKYGRVLTKEERMGWCNHPQPRGINGRAGIE